MSTIVNDRDIILQAASIRLAAVSTNYISFTSSATGFIVNGSTVTPPIITLTFTSYGQLVGNPNISYLGISTGTVTYVTNNITTVTIAAANMTADVCTVTASITFLGTVYTTAAKVSGSVTQPAVVGIGTASIEGLNIRLNWPRSSEVDVQGYEVRSSDTNWGIDSLYLYNGSPTTCTTAPGLLNVLKTYYIRAYDTTKLYSPTSTPITYTVVIPPAPTGVTATFSTTSGTTSTAYLTWNNTTPPFGFKQYRVRLTLPDTSFTDTIVNTPNLTVIPSWTGTASAVVYVTDILGNESLGSVAFSAVKTPPNNVATPIVTVVGTKLLVDWVDVAITTLPILGYEVRTSNSNWGIDTNYIWKGSVSECQVSVGTLNSTINYYVKAIDTDKVYSTSVNIVSYTRVAPPAVVGITYNYSISNSGLASLTLNWNRPSGETFAIDFYRVTLAKPSGTITADIYSNSWTVDVDWSGSVTFSVQTVDIFGVTSSTFSQSLVKIDPNITTSTYTTIPINNSLAITWTNTVARPAITWSRATTIATITDTNHGYTNLSIVNITATSDLLAIPIGSYTITVLNGNTYTITCLNAGGTSGTITNTTPSSLDITDYEVRASNNSTVLYKGQSSTYLLPGNTVAVGANTWYLYAIDAAGKYSVAKILSFSYVTLGAVTITPTFTTNSTALFKWTAPSGSFGVVTYNLSLSATGMTTKTATISASEWEIPIGWYNTIAILSVIPVDGLGTTGVSSSSTLTKANPGAVTSVVYPFSSTGTGQICTISWTPPSISLSTQVPISYYSITITKPGLASVTTTSTTNTYITSVDWEGTASIDITTVDTVGATSTIVTTSLIKASPSAPTAPIILIKGSGITITWTQAVAGSLPIAGYQLSTSNVSPQINACIYKGSASSIDVTSVSASNTWYVFSYDTAGKYCSIPLTVSKNFTGPSIPQSITSAFTFGTALFKWSVPATSDFAIDRYELTLTASGMTTITSKLYSTDWEIPVIWNNTTATLSITPYDIAGFAGTTGTTTLTKNIPTIPAVPVISITGTNIDIDWADNTQSITQLGIIDYEIKDYKGTSIWRGAGSKAQVPQFGKSAAYAGTWTRVTTTATIVETLHGFVTGNIVSILTTSDATTIPIGIYIITYIDNNTYSIVCTNTGATSGTLSTGYAYSLYAYDYNGIASLARQFEYTPILPANIALGTFTSTFGSSLTDASLTLTWVGILPTYGLDYYEVTYDTNIVKVSSTSLTILPLPLSWIGNKTFTVKTVDSIGNRSTGTSIAVTKSVPAIVSTYSSQVIDNNIMLYWTLPTRTSLPISAMRVKKGLSWAGGTLIGDKSGTFTTIFEQAGGTYTYWMAAVDTDKQEGIPISFPVSVSQPPDFIYNGEQVSTFSGTYNNAKLDTGAVVLPIDTSVQYAAHFTNIRVASMTVSAGGTGYVVGDTFRLNTGIANATDYATGQVTSVVSGIVSGIILLQGGSYTTTPTVSAGTTAPISGIGTGLTITITTGGNWTTPSAQVTAGFPVYIQPTLVTGYYEEVFDFGTTLSSSQITLTTAGTTIGGTPVVNTSLSYSSDNITYSANYSSTSVFATNFRYVKVRITATQNDINKGLYTINNISVRLDSKIINWSGSTNCISTNIDGTLANFGKEFVDVTAISITPNSTTFASPVYDFKDAVLTATYSVTSNICTITTVLAHGFSANATGQQVRLSFNSGGATNGIYTVTSVTSANVFTVATVTANTYGTLSAYSQGMRIYLFNNSGTRISGAVTWALRGY